MSLSDFESENIYSEVVKAVTSYILRRYWYPTNSESGYIERSWREGRKPDELVQEFVKQYGEAVEHRVQRTAEWVCPECYKHNLETVDYCVGCETRRR